MHGHGISMAVGNEPSEAASSLMLTFPEPQKTVNYVSFIQRKWGEFSEKHYCGLISSLRRTDIVKELVDSGVCIKLRRRVRKFVMISKKHPYTQRVFRSKTALRNEQVKHLVRYYWMIHPFSMAAFYHDLFMMCVYLYTLLMTIPINWVFVRVYPATKWHTFALDMIITVDVFVNCFIGCFDEDMMHVQMYQKQVIKKYMRTYLFFDVVSCLPSYLIYFFLKYPGPNHLNLIKWTMVGRLVRVLTIESTLQKIQYYCGFSSAIYVALQILMRMFVTILFCVGLSSGINQYPYLRKYISEKRDKALAQELTYHTVSLMFGVGKVPDFNHPGEVIRLMIFPTLAMTLHFWIISRLYTLWQRVLAASQVGEDHIQQVNGYLQYKGIPPKTRDEIYCYFDFTYQKKFFDETAILHIMSENLRKELPNYKLGQQIEKIKFMKLLPHHVIMTIISNMQTQYHCAGDIIFKAGSMGRTLYFIKHGTVALLDKNNIEICHLEDDSYYGDLSIIISRVRMETMLAISPCEICTLGQRMLFEILDTFPALKEQVFELTLELVVARTKDYIVNSFRRRSSVPYSIRVQKIAPSETDV